jgi:MFS superfamily sulfate permease-like transporter
VLQIGAGFVRAGVIGYYFPSAVIKGMLAGIGIVLILKQIPHAFGYDSSWMGELEFIQCEIGHPPLAPFASGGRVYPQRETHRR